MSKTTAVHPLLTIALLLATAACASDDVAAPRQAERIASMKPACEKCNTPLAAHSDAYVCSYECTFCKDCTLEMLHVCPNCGGRLEPRQQPRKTP